MKQGETLKKSFHALLVLTVLSIAFIALLAGCGGDSTETTATSALPETGATTTLGESGSNTNAGATGPVKIGLIVPLQGTFAQLGADTENGFNLLLKESGGKVAGREIIVISEDSEGKPELGPTKANKLIDVDKVQIISGIVHSGVAGSIRDILDQKKIPTVITNAGTDDLTGGRKSPYIFRTSFANRQDNLAAGWYAYNKLGYKKIIVIAPDYSAGHEHAAGFMKYFKESGGTVVQEIYPPLDTADFAPYLTGIAQKSDEVDAVFMFFAGAAAIKLVNQYAEYGLKDTLPLFASGHAVPDSYLSSIQDAALGIQNFMHYTPSLDNPENKRFVDAYEAEYNERPSVYAEQAYVAAKAIVMALEALNGDATDPDAFAAALRAVKFDAPRGPIAFDENQNVVHTVYILEVKLIDGQPVNVVVDSIPNVGQDWTPAAK